MANSTSRRTTSVKYNSRAGVMFEAIRKNVNLVSADILDLGCGYGDLGTYSATHGARHVTFVDKDESVILISRAKIIQKAPKGLTWQALVLDIDDRHQLASLGYYHVAYCTSVLPYLKNRDMVLGFMASRAETSVIEMQYYGDGPGPESIRDDDDMGMWLENFWASVEAIGKSYTGRTPAFRTLWKCTNGGEEWQEKLRPRSSK